jgi:hypothetical protein
VHVTVDLAADPPSVSLVEPADCTGFDIVVHGPGDLAGVGRALADASMGGIEGDEALVTVDGVRRLAADQVGDGWETDFAAMLEFAAGRGWMSDDGEAIRAHIERH